jgi:integrase
MRGSIQKHVGKRGVSWYAVVDLPPDPATGKRRQKRVSAKTRRECEERMAALIAAPNTGAAVSVDKTTVAAFVERWLASNEANVKPSTARRYRDLLRLHVLPVIGALPLVRTTPLHVQELHAAWRAKGLSPTSCYHAHYILHRVFAQAVRWRILPNNPCDFTDAPRRGTTELQVWNATQVAAVLSACAGDDLEALWRLALLTGMRRGELLGLRWDDVDLERGVLAVRRTLSRGQGGMWEIGSPKTTSGRRSIALPPSARESLQRHRLRQLERRLALGLAWHDEGYVFTNATGGPLHVNSLAHRFGKLIERASVPRIRFHDLRHTSATLLLAQGVHPKIVQERLGHANIAMTLDRYSHVTMDMQRQAADALDAALQSAENRLDADGRDAAS